MQRASLLPTAAVAMLALLAGCSRAVVTSPPGPPAAGFEEVGFASWYGAQHQGRRTSSGEVFDMNQLTAAHRTLPFGTRLLVTNRDTSRTAEVRINDRGPFVKGRILDVSYAVARQLGVAAEGVFPVLLRVISLPGRKTEIPVADRSSAEGGSIAEPKKAEAQGEEVGGVATVGEIAVADRTVYRVDLGSYSTPTRTRPAAQPLADRNFPLLIAPR